MDRYSWRGRPMDGIWLVSKNSHSWIGKPDISPLRISLEEHRQYMLTVIDIALKNCDNKYISRNDIVTEILNQLEKEIIKTNPI